MQVYDLAVEILQIIAIDTRQRSRLYSLPQEIISSELGNWASISTYLPCQMFLHIQTSLFNFVRHFRKLCLPHPVSQLPISSYSKIFFCFLVVFHEIFIAESFSGSYMQFPSNLMISCLGVFKALDGFIRWLLRRIGKIKKNMLRKKIFAPNTTNMFFSYIYFFVHPS